jgi:hypothetical protein
MSRGAAAAVLLAAFTLLFPYSIPACGGSGAAPRSTGLSITITSPPNGTEVKGDVVVAGNASGREGSTLVVRLSIDDGPSYPAGGNLSWSWLWSTYSVQDGPHKVTARVSDGTDELAAAIEVTVANSMPVPRISGSSPPPDLPPLNDSGILTFSISIEGDYAGNINWSVDGTTVQDGTDRNYTYIAGANSTGNHTVEARLASGDPTAAVWNLTVLPGNRPPVVSGFSPGTANLTAHAGDTLRFNVTAYDPEGRGLVYRWSVDLAPAPGNLTGESAKLTFNTTGTHAVAVEISDGQASRTVSWNVTVNEPPALGMLDFMPCLVYIVLGLFLGIWYGRRNAGQPTRSKGTGDR